MRTVLERILGQGEVTPDLLCVGDRVLVECEIVARVDPMGGEPRFVQVGGYPYRIDHVIARPVDRGVWQAGDQRLWTWGWPMVNPRTITRLRKGVHGERRR